MGAQKEKKQTTSGACQETGLDAGKHPCCVISSIGGVDVSPTISDFAYSELVLEVIPYEIFFTLRNCPDSSMANASVKDTLHPERCSKPSFTK